MNEVMLMGRLTRDPYYGEGENGRGPYKRAVFYLAVNRSFSKETAFIRVTAFDKTAELVQKYLSQGKQIVVIGELATGNYTDKDTGKRVYTMEVNAKRIEFTGKKEAASNGKEAAPASGGRIPRYSDDAGFTNIPYDMADELPFR